MKKILSTCALSAVAFVAASCASIDSPPAPEVYNDHASFSSAEDYKTTTDVYRNEALLAVGNSSNTSVTIDLSDQRMMLLVNGQVAMDTPTSTGRAGKRTPTGTFRIMEKIRDKRSNIFGRYYRGDQVVFGGDRRKYTGSKSGLRYVGSPLPYWMRLTGGGIGIHYSKNVPRYPASAGCIRTPMAPVQTIYSKVRTGTKVVVQY